MDCRMKMAGAHVSHDGASSACGRVLSTLEDKATNSAPFSHLTSQVGGSPHFALFRAVLSGFSLRGAIRTNQNGLFLGDMPLGRDVNRRFLPSTAAQVCCGCSLLSETQTRQHQKIRRLPSTSIRPHHPMLGRSCAERICGEKKTCLGLGRVEKLTFCHRQLLILDRDAGTQANASPITHHPSTNSSSSMDLRRAELHGFRPLGYPT